MTLLIAILVAYISFVIWKIQWKKQKRLEVLSDLFQSLMKIREAVVEETYLQIEKDESDFSIVGLKIPTSVVKLDFHSLMLELHLPKDELIYVSIINKLRTHFLDFPDIGLQNNLDITAAKKKCLLWDEVFVKIIGELKIASKDHFNLFESNGFEDWLPFGCHIDCKKIKGCWRKIFTKDCQN